MNTLSFYNLLLLSICTILISCVESEDTTVEQPTNIILLMGDDHGWEETAYNGHAYLQTPVLDEMAASGLRLDRFYSASPVCSPTRGSVITGRHPNRYGTFTPNWSIRPEEVSIAQVLRDAGYSSGHFGKWHLGPVKAASPTNPGAMGFDSWLSHDNFFEIDPVLSRDGAAPVKIEGESSEILIDETIRFIEEAQQQDKPFFAVVWFGSPHEPYSGLEEDLALYQNLPDSLSEQYVTLTSMETGKPVQRPLDSVLQERYAEITAMDRAIGKLREHLSAQGLQKNTLLWYCGDNGVPSSGKFNASLRGQKAMMYEGGIRVPGIIEWPQAIPEARSSSVNAVTSDMLPTLAALSGQPLPERPMDGINLMPLIRGEMEERPAPICFWDFEPGPILAADPEPYIDPELQQGTTPLVKIMAGQYTRSFQNFHYSDIGEDNYAGERAILDNRYKLVIDGEEGSGKELFDMDNDPEEQHNLISSKPEIAEKLEQQLLAWQESVLESLTGADYRE
ncbi:arylsulfatase A-like enzyme [Catalinimonas alkaloidigena]|uniref:sulfatase family protein n=1 Tax=Catalinimonas alkaloidigena TaxID=1075417 RepID=UPI002405F4DF|nr:sulfatase-like hydrolase/transferase [Catalinimonas alkaloidigena]MDF9798064.1 arylsulfatase A-like enzyme [Catalinimonas alkaloidigena]